MAVNPVAGRFDGEEGAHEERDGVPSRARLLTVGVLLLLALVVPRIVHLGADPAPSVSADFLTDEGWWCRNARQHALTGNAVQDEFNQAILVAPGFHVLLVLAFRIGGVTFGAARAVSAGAGLITLAAIGWTAFRLAGPRTALWSVSLLGLSAPFLLLNRTAFAESAVVLSLSLVAAAVAEAVATGASGTPRGVGARGGPLGSRSEGEGAFRRAAWYFVAGSLAAVAFWTKTNALYIAALPILVAFVVHRREGARFVWASAFAAAGFVLGVLPVAAIVVLPDPAAWVTMNRLIAGSYVAQGWDFLPASLLNFPRNEAWGDLAPIAALGFGLFLVWVRRLAARDPSDSTRGCAGMAAESSADREELADADLRRRRPASDEPDAGDPESGEERRAPTRAAAYVGRVEHDTAPPSKPAVAAGHHPPAERDACGRALLPTVAGIWLLLSAVTTMIVPYQPARRMLTLLPPLCLIVADALAREGRRGPPRRSRAAMEGDGECGAGDGVLPGSPPAAPFTGRLARVSLVAFLLWPAASLAWGTAAGARVLLRGEPARWALGANVGAIEGVVIAGGAILMAAMLARMGRGRRPFEDTIDMLIVINGVYPIWLVLRWTLSRCSEFTGVAPGLALVADPLAVALIPVAILIWNRRRRAAAGPSSASRIPSWASRIRHPVLFALLFAAANIPSLLPIAMPTHTIEDAARRITAVVPEDAVLAGAFADTVGLETRLRTVEVRPHFGMNRDPYLTWPRAVLVTAVRYERQEAEHIPAWAPRDTIPLVDLPLCPNPWTGEPRFVLRLRARAAGRTFAAPEGDSWAM